VPPEDRSLIAGFAVAVVAALIFAALAHAVMRGATEPVDISVRNAIHAWAAPELTWAMRAVTQLGAVAFLLLLGTLVIWKLLAAGRPRAAVLFAVAAVGAQIFDQALKFWFRRPRPEVFFGMAQPATYSFPSGHSVTSCCFYGALAAILATTAKSPRHKAAIWGAAGILTLAIGFSRIYLGVHYPTDVVGGYLVAIVWAAIVRCGYQFWLARMRPSIS
jgi:undecaprenyl-diphosphatase